MERLEVNMHKFLVLLVMFFCANVSANEKSLSIVSFNGDKLLIMDPVTKKKERIINKKIKLPIVIKKVVKSGRYLVSLNNKDVIVTKTYVNTDRVVVPPSEPCPEVYIKGKLTASTRGLGGQC
jgi:hypothetical protein